MLNGVLRPFYALWYLFGDKLTLADPVSKFVLESLGRVCSMNNGRQIKEGLCKPTIEQFHRLEEPSRQWNWWHWKPLTESQKLFSKMFFFTAESVIKRILDWNGQTTESLYSLFRVHVSWGRSPCHCLLTQQTKAHLRRKERRTLYPPSISLLTCMCRHPSSLSFHILVQYFDLAVQLMTAECLPWPRPLTSYYRCAAEGSGVQAHCPLLRSHLHCSEWHWWLFPYGLLRGRH